MNYVVGTNPIASALVMKLATDIIIAYASLMNFMLLAPGGNRISGVSSLSRSS